MSSPAFVLYESTDTEASLLTDMLKCGSGGVHFAGYARSYLELVKLDNCDGHSVHRLRAAFLAARDAGWFDTELSKKVDKVRLDLRLVMSLKVRPQPSRVAHIHTSPPHTTNH
jgi:hypothetical protein